MKSPPSQKTRREPSSQRFRRHRLLPLPRHQPEHLPRLRPQTRPLLLEHAARHLRLPHRRRRRRGEILRPESGTAVAALHALHPARLDGLCARAAPGAVFKAASRESEPEGAAVGPGHDCRRAVFDDRADVGPRLASV